MKFNWYKNLFICAHKGHRKDIRIGHLTICVILVKLRKNIQGNMELIVAQDASTEAAHFITKWENYLLSQWYLQGTWQLTVPRGLTETQPTKLYINFAPHITPFKPAAYHKVSAVYVEVPQSMGSLNMCIICTQYVAQCWEQVTPEFGITLIEKVGLDQVEIFDFQLPCHGTFARRML